MPFSVEVTNSRPAAAASLDRIPKHRRECFGGFLGIERERPNTHRFAQKTAITLIFCINYIAMRINTQVMAIDLEPIHVAQPEKKIFAHDAVGPFDGAFFARPVVTPEEGHFRISTVDVRKMNAVLVHIVHFLLCQCHCG